MKGRLLDFSVGFNRKQRITLELEGDFRDIYDKLKESDLDIEVKKYRNKRSKDANSYMWVLLDKLADALRTTKEDLYLGYIRQYGMYKDFTLTEDEAKTFKVVWEAFGTGWPTEQVDYTSDGNRVVIRAYYGSSQYDTKRMARLIDAVVQDCKELGIETMTPDELMAMLTLMNEKGDYNAQPYRSHGSLDP